MEQQIGRPDESNGPAETIICYSKDKNLTAVYVAAGFIFLGILFIIVFQNYFFNYFFGLFAIIVSLIIGRYHYKNAYNVTPQIILNAHGIQTASTPFYKWENINGEAVPRISEGKTTGYYLVYNCPHGAVKFSISFLATDERELKNLLRVYRQRSNTNKTAGLSAPLK